MALTKTQRDDKYDELRLAPSIKKESAVNQNLMGALQKRASTSLGTPERAEADKAVAVAEASAGY